MEDQTQYIYKILLTKLMKQLSDENEKAEKAEARRLAAETKLQKSTDSEAKAMALSKDLAVKLRYYKFSLSSLSSEAKKAIELLKASEVGICSRCRYASGCLSCSVPHAQRYYLRKEAAKLGLRLTVEEAEKLRQEAEKQGAWASQTGKQKRK